MVEIKIYFKMDGTISHRLKDSSHFYLSIICVIYLVSLWTVILCAKNLPLEINFKLISLICILC